MRIIDLALKDLSQLARDGMSAVFLIIMPIAFTLLFGFVFSGTGEEEDPRLPVGYLDQDGGSALSGHLLAMLDDSDAIRPVVLEDQDPDAAMEQVAGEELAAVVIVPAGYGPQALDPAAEAALGPAALKPTVIAAPASNAGQTAQSGIQAVLARLAGAVQAAHLSARAFEAQGGTADEAFMEGALTQAVEAWQEPPLTVTTSQSGAILEEEPPIEPNDFAHSSAGIMVQFAMAGLIGAAEILVLERKSGALRRMLTTAISRIEIILGHFLAMYLMILAQLVMLVAFGQIALKVDYMHAPLATLLMILTTALWSASLGLLIGIFSKTQEQSIMFTLILMLLLSGLGGAWMPLEFTSQTFQTVGHLTPVAWAIDGLENIVLRGLGLESVLLPAAILVGYAALLFAVGVWRFRFE